VCDDEHVLLLTQHHIISDGWSTGVMVREVGALYTAFCQGQPDPLPALTIHYADYAAWQRGWLQGEELERQVAFWRAHLRDAPALLELPTDRPRPPVQSHAGGAVALTLPSALTVGLRTLSQRHGVTLFMTLLAGWSTLLSRLSGQSDVVIGTPVANRQRREVEDLIGFFVNTLALRVRLEDQPSVAQLLQQVKETTLSAFGHQELPFEQVVEAVQPVRSLSHSPVFQVMLALNNTPEADALSLPGLTFARIETVEDAAHFDLSLSLNDDGEHVAGALIYASALFDRRTIERMAGHFVTLLEGMVADEAGAVGRLPLLTVSERDQVVRGFNATAVDYPDETLIHELFERQVAMQPDAVAVIDGNQRLTYAALNERANRLAHYLIAQGVRADDRVAICIERSAELLVGLLGILKAGGAYVPLDPDYPADRLNHMLADSAPVALLTQQTFADRLAEFAVPTLVLDAEAAPSMLETHPASNPAVRESGLTARHLAYVIYTSGSTGTPKGVMVEHRSVNRLVINNPYAHIGAEDCVVHCANPAFDAATWEIWAALLHGARLLVIPSQALLDAAAFGGLLRAHDVTVLHLTVGLFNQYAEAFADIFPTLNYLLFGGEKADVGRVLQVLRNSPPRHLVQCYGPTETTTFASTHAITALADDAHSVSIGRPIANTSIYILDSQGEPVPLGVTGELYIGGDGVARGYLNRPELTAERFLKDPFAARPAGRMYRTGDLGRWLPDGTIEYQGRNDFQVKIRGFRIELGEIEAKLAACDGVREAVVLAREDVPGDKRLVAYVVSDEGVELHAAQLRAALSGRLPDYMLPAAFIPLESLPLTPNGKLDRRMLPAPDQAALAHRAYEAPQDEVEQTLATIWQQLLGVARVGRHDHFFELGGHSLLAVQLQDRIEDELLVDVSLRQLFENSELHQLGQLITSLRFEKFIGDEAGELELELSSLSIDELEALLASENIR
jgi:amino acid adenylation domain-containing protein